MEFRREELAKIVERNFCENDPPRTCHVTATPLFELISVTIHYSESVEKELLIDDGKPCHIFGRIWVTNAQGDTFELYKRDKEKPDIVNLGNSLIHIGLSSPDCVVIPSSLIAVNVLLKDSAHDDIEIAKGRFYLDYKNSYYTEEGVEKVQGQSGAYALLQYATFPFAVVATVEVLYFNKDDHVPSGFWEYDPENDEDDFDDTTNYVCDDTSIVTRVSGTIVAEINNRFKKSKEGKSCIEIVALDTLPEQCIKVNSGTFIELARSVFAVPSYTSLKIRVNLSNLDSQVVISGVAEFNPRDSGVVKRDIIGGNGRIRVRVDWNHAYKQLNSDRKMKQARSADSLVEGTNKISKQHKNQRSYSPPPPVRLSTSGSKPRVVPEDIDFPCRLVEVHSIFVFSNDCESCHVHGIIYVFDGTQFLIFNKDENHSVASSDFKKLESVMAPSRCFDALDEFGLCTKLRDENGSALSLGYMSYSSHNLREFYDKRMCSTIRGSSGFAAVHYTIFRDGIPAKVKFLLYGSAPVDSYTKVCGRITAQNGEDTYQTLYEQQYFQSILFDGDVVMKHHGCDLPGMSVSNLPLLKDIVAGARKSSLDIQVDLNAAPVGEQDESDPSLEAHAFELRGTFVIEAGESENEFEIITRKYRLVLLVERTEI